MLARHIGDSLLKRTPVLVGDLPTGELVAGQAGDPVIPLVVQ